MRSIQGHVHGLSEWDVDEEARAHVSASGLLLTLDDGRHVQLPWSALKVGQNYIYDHHATVEGVIEGDQHIRFTAEGPELGQQMARWAPPAMRAQLGQLTETTQGARRTNRALLSASVVLLAIMLTSLSWLPTLAVYFCPPHWEELIGQSAFNSPASSNPVLTDAVQQTWKAIEPGLQPNPYTFRIKVVDSPEINAYAAPGGYVVVFTGLLQDVQRPEELAGVLAHESQHVIQRHTLKTMFHHLQLDVVLAILFRQQDAAELTRLGTQLEGLSYSRANEAQADTEGAKVLMRAHIDPTGLPDFFRRLEAEHPIHGLSLMHDHPSNTDRIASLEAEIAATPHDVQPMHIDWDAVRAQFHEDKSH